MESYLKPHLKLCYTSVFSIHKYSFLSINKNKYTGAPGRLTRLSMGLLISAQVTPWNLVSDSSSGNIFCSNKVIRYLHGRGLVRRKIRPWLEVWNFQPHLQSSGDGRAVGD